MTPATPITCPWLARIRPEQISCLKGRTGHVHLSDCDGGVHDNLPPGRGVTPIAEYLAAIRDTGFNRTVSIELEYAQQPDQIIQCVTDAYEETDKIMRTLGCRG